MTLTIIADSNIAHLHDYFNASVLNHPVKVIAMAGRDITSSVIEKHQPHALLIRSVTKVDASLLDINKSVTFVGSATIGTDHVDQDYLAKRHIVFKNAAGCSKHSVAQYVLTAALTLRPSYWQSCSHLYGESAHPAEPVKLGIIGLGNIGSTLAKYAQNLGWQVLGYDPFLPHSDINNASFDEVLTQSQAISLHVPLTLPDSSPYPTYHLMGSSAFAKMPANTLLINTARGAVISESALLADLMTHKRNVVLDVFEYEPTVSKQLLERLSIATPHIAGYTLEGKLRGTQMIFDAFVKVFGLEGQGLQTQSISGQTEPLMDQLLPDHPYSWESLKNNPERLSEFYDIQADDALLRQAVDSKRQKVIGSAFDSLRKNYALRREWQFDNS